jgi:molybdate transport system substrate-binding protein
MRRVWARVGALGAALALGGGPRPAPAGERAFTVAAAADLHAALPEIAAAFERQTGVKPVLSFSSSGTLMRQIQGGAPFDVLLSANEQYVDMLAGQRRVERRSIRAYAVGRLVLVVNRRSGVKATVPRDLLRRQIRRIAIANPEHAPYGKAAREALRKAGVWTSLERKVVLADNVRQALQFVQTGNAEAGLVSLSGTGVPEVNHTLVDRNLHAPIVQAAGIVSGSPFAARAAEFLDFLTGPAAQEVLRRHGFEPPPRAGRR